MTLLESGFIPAVFLSSIASSQYEYVYYACMHTSPGNCIDGIEFLLSDEKVKRMIPPLGIAKKIIRLIPRPEVNYSLHVYFVMIIVVTAGMCH